LEIFEKKLHTQLSFYDDMVYQILGLHIDNIIIYHLVRKNSTQNWRF
jgi:hypothetical protein